MDERLLRELELLAVARLYGLVDVPAATAPSAHAPAPASATAPSAHAPAPAPATAPASRAAPRTPRAVPVARADVAGLGWEALREAVRECRACALCERRKQAVFGVGQEAGPWMFVGEGPGADEDAQGEPFVGQAGRLLDAMLAAAGLSRARDAYIANVVKCRPPGNRTPTPDEAAACGPFLDRQIALVRPQLIVALGKTAAARLLASEASLASLRGRVHDYRGTPVVVTYHPAYLLRNLSDKARAWEDLLFARRTWRSAA